MSAGAIVAELAVGSFVYFIAKWLGRDLAAWRRSQRRGRVRRVPPRPAQTDWEWPVAQTAEELDRLYEASPHRTGRLV